MNSVASIAQVRSMAYKNGKLHGDNTDGVGFVTDLHRLWGI